MTSNSPKPVSRITTWLLIAVFFLPLLIAMGLYFTRDHWNFATQQYGQLVNPPLAIETLSLSTPDGEPWLSKQEPSLWRLLLITDDCVDAACDLQLAKINSIHEAVGKDYPRVNVLLITRDKQVNKKFLENFNQEVSWLVFTAPAPLANGLWITDPNGYIILQYPLNVPGHDMLKDLRHLLRISQIG